MPYSPLANLLRRLTISVILLAASNAAIAVDDRVDEIRDLQYGVSLYHLFQDDHFSAITDLLVAEKRKPILNQGQDPELLLGGLLMDYGIEKDAATIFNKLLNAHAPDNIRDRSWFQLARIQYEDGEYTKARENLHRIGKTLSDYRQAERQQVLTNINIKLEQYSEANKYQALIPDESVWKPYAQFNLGVSQIAQGNIKNGIPLLESLIESEVISGEREALHDKAHIALGFTYLQSGQYASASEQFKGVSLSGPHSDTALLGLGWSHHKQSQYKHALIPWIELNNSRYNSLAAQESLLAVPHTLELLELPQQAVMHYNRALEIYEQQLDELTELNSAIEKNTLLASLLLTNKQDEGTRFIDTPFLQSLISSQAYQHAVANYRDLHQLEQRLMRWEQQLPTYSLMLSEREQLYNVKSPSIEARNQRQQIRDYELRYQQLSNEYEKAIQGDDLYALATEEERDLLDTLQDIKSRLNQLMPARDLSAQSDKYRLMHGLVSWQIRSDAIPRQWEIKKGLKSLQMVLTQSQQQEQSLHQTWLNAPRSFLGFAEQIDDKLAQTQSLKTLSSQLKAEQGRAINRLAQAAIERFRQINNRNRSHANFALARLYDTMKQAEDQ